MKCLAVPERVIQPLFKPRGLGIFTLKLSLVSALQDSSDGSHGLLQWRQNRKKNITKREPAKSVVTWPGVRVNMPLPDDGKNAHRMGFASWVPAVESGTGGLRASLGTSVLGGLTQGPFCHVSLEDLVAHGLAGNQKWVLSYLHNEIQVKVLGTREKEELRLPALGFWRAHYLFRVVWVMAVMGKKRGQCQTLDHL